MSILGFLIQASVAAKVEASMKDFWTIRLTDIIMIAAVFLAPLFAVQVQWLLQLRREARQRKLWIFKTLMATRATRLAVDHVQALNLIDVEFDGKNKAENDIRIAWKVYLDHLNSPMDWAKASEPEKKGWDEKVAELLSDLLQKMGSTLGYDYDKVYLKKNAYVPVGHGETEIEQILLRRGLLKLIAGNSAVKMEVTSFPAMITDAEAEEQARMRRACADFLEKREPWPVKIVTDGDKAG